MAKKILGLMTAFLMLAACNLIPPSTPSPGELETSVFQTLTALPSLTPRSSTLPAVVTPTFVVIAPTVSAPTNIPLATSSPYPTAAGQQPTVVQAYSPLYADQFIRYYYNYINQRNYQLTWSLLTDSFKFAVNGPDQGGFLGYANFWDTVQRVDIFNVTINSLSSGNAAVLVNMQYSYKNGVVASSLQSFNLIYDPGRGTWLFNSTTPISTPPPSPVIVQTPEQFLTSYFSNVNAGNLTLTWTLLSDRFKANVNHNSYDEYASFWNSVSRVDITSISVVSQVGTNAIVNISLVFNYRSGLVAPTTVRYHLIYDTGRSTWLFDSP